MASKSGKRSRNPMGRPLMLNAEQLSQLVSITEEQPHISMDDLVFVYRRRTGISISKPTAKKYLDRAGVQRMAPQRKKRKPSPPPPFVQGDESPAPEEAAPEASPPEPTEPAPAADEPVPEEAAP